MGGKWWKGWGGERWRMRAKGATRKAPGGYARSTTMVSSSGRRTSQRRSAARGFDHSGPDGRMPRGVSLFFVTVTLRGAGLTEDQVVAVASHGEDVAPAPAARTRSERSRQPVERAGAS